MRQERRSVGGSPSLRDLNHCLSYKYRGRVDRVIKIQPVRLLALALSIAVVLIFMTTSVTISSATTDSRVLSASGKQFDHRLKQTDHRTHITAGTQSDPPSDGALAYGLKQQHNIGTPLASSSGAPKLSMRRGKAGKARKRTPVDSKTFHSPQFHFAPSKSANEIAGQKPSSCKENGHIELERKVGAKAVIPHAKHLQDAHLCRSFEHQLKFFSVRNSVLSWIKTHAKQRNLLKTTGKFGRLFAFIINDEYALRHIFKSGGTSVQDQTGAGRHGHVPQWRVGNRSLIATVREPLDHFLSGWAECGFRNFHDMMSLSTSPTHDDRVRGWLRYLRTHKISGKGLGKCIPHSMPQANFLWQNQNISVQDFEWDKTISVVGDMTEIPGLLELTGFHYDASIRISRKASENEIKKQHFPSDTSLLSNSTVQDICRYVALDYYLFAFDLPVPCREELMDNIASMKNTSPY